MQTNVDSTTSLVTLHLSRVAVEPAATVDLAVSMAQIWEIFLETFSEICLEAVEDAVPTTDQ